MRLTEFLCSFWSAAAQPCTALVPYRRLEEPKITTDRATLKNQIDRLIIKHEHYAKSLTNTTALTRSQNKLKLLTLAQSFLSRPAEGVRQTFYREKQRQDTLCITESHQYNDGWWPWIGMGYLWQTLPSETAAVVASAKRMMDNTQIYELYDEESSRMFARGDSSAAIDNTFSPPTTPRRG